MVSEKRHARIVEVASKRESGLIIVLEDIHDPHNAEAIFRSCDAFGVQDVYLIFNKEKPYNPSKIGKSSSSSANKWLSFHIFNSVKDCFKELRKKKYVCVGTVLSGKSECLVGSNLSDKKLALFVGNEHGGLSEEVLKEIDFNLKIPMKGMVESLNVSVATAIFLYEISRQRGGKFSLKNSDVAKLVEDFEKR